MSGLQYGPRRSHRSIAGALLLTSAFLGEVPAQELPPSGVYGFDLVYATDPTGATSQLYSVYAPGGIATPLGGPFSGVPSRWAHRRRTLGALETAIARAEPFVVMTPTGDAVGNGGIHFVDARFGSVLADFVLPTGNPAGYDLALVEPLQFVFSAEDDGAGDTTLRGYSYATPGSLVPLSPPTLTLRGPPAAYVNRIGVDLASLSLQVPTARGVQIVQLSGTAPNLVAGRFVSAAGFRVTTNPTFFDRADGRIWIVGTSSFVGSGDPSEAGYLAWKADGSTSWSGHYGVIAGRNPPRNYVPAIGAEELAVVSNGTDAYAYYPLRDPDPSSGFVRAAAIGTVRFIGTSDPVLGLLLCPDAMGEPFQIPTVSGTRVAVESGEGPPWYNDPPGGAEKISIIYSPLDPLGAATVDGLLGVAGPLGGRISHKGMDRPLWTRDGKAVFAFTSHFPGAPNPAVPGIEMLVVPDAVAVDNSSLAVLVVDNPNAPNQSILQPTSFNPREPGRAAFLAPLSFTGTVFNDGMASAMEWKKPPLGQKQLESPLFVQSPFIPDFPAILPPSFNDATGSTVPIPARFGARRVSFDLHPGFGLIGLTMVGAIDDTLRIQPSGWDFLAAVGLVPPLPPVVVHLPAGWITTSEILSF